MFYFLQLLRNFPTPFLQFRAGLELLCWPAKHKKGGVGKQRAETLILNLLQVIMG